jgi:hypothetical protein
MLVYELIIDKQIWTKLLLINMCVCGKVLSLWWMGLEETSFFLYKFITD